MPPKAMPPKAMPPKGPQKGPQKGKGGQQRRGPTSKKVLIRLLPHAIDQESVEKAIEACGYKLGTNFDFLYFVKGKMRWVEGASRQIMLPAASSVAHICVLLLILITCVTPSCSRTQT
jgi:hypothetical protein